MIKDRPCGLIFPLLVPGNGPCSFPPQGLYCCWSLPRALILSSLSSLLDLTSGRPSYPSTPSPRNLLRMAFLNTLSSTRAGLTPSVFLAPSMRNIEPEAHINIKWLNEWMGKWNHVLVRIRLVAVTNPTISRSLFFTWIDSSQNFWLVDSFLHVVIWLCFPL